MFVAFIILSFNDFASFEQKIAFKGSGALTVSFHSISVMGAQKEAYEVLGPVDSFIHIDDFKGPQELANYLHELDLNDHSYNQFFRYVDTGEFKFPISTMCRLCDHINYFKESGYQQFYTKDQFEEFWTSDDCNLNSLFLGDDSSGNSVP